MITIHNLSASGGTIIAKILGTSDDVFLLNEKHPHQMFPVGQKNFGPMRVTEELFSRYGSQIARSLMRPELIGYLETGFRNQLDEVLEISARLDRRLVLRDWSHADFFFQQSSGRGALLEFLKKNYPDREIASIATIRNPLDGYLSGLRSGFLKAIDNSFENYCARTFSFFQHYQSLGCRIYQYEQIISSPRKFLDDVTELTGITFPDDFESQLDRFQLSGDSGRKSARLELRPPRAEDMELRNQLEQTEIYKKVRTIFQY